MELRQPSRWTPEAARLTTDGWWESQNFNYLMKRPEGIWKPLPKSFPQGSGQFVLEQAGTGIQFSFLPERLSATINSQGDTPDLVEVVKKNLTTIDPNVKFSREKPEKLGGLEGLSFEAAWKNAEAPLGSVRWIMADHGWAYQLTVAGPAEKMEQIRTTAHGIFGGFNQFDRRLAAPGWEPLGTNGFVSKYYPYTVRIPDDSWRNVPNLSSNFPAADFSARKMGGYTLSILPTAFPYPLPRETVFKALAARTVMAAITESLERTPWKGQGLVGDTLTWESGAQSRWHARVRFAMGTNTAYLVIADGPGSAPLAQLDRLLDLAELQDQPVKLGSLALPESLARSQGLIQNELGLYYFKARNMARAAVFFHAAGEFWPGNEIFLVNECEALAGQRDFAAVLARLEQRKELVATNLPLQAERALCQWQAGDTNSAIRGYQQIFEAGFAQLTSLRSFCTLLLDSGDTNQAVRRMEALVATNSTTEARLLQAFVQRRAGAPADAVRILETERDRTGLSDRVGYELALAQMATKDALGAIRTCDALLARGFETATAWYLKGQAQFQRNDYPAAKKSFEAAINLAPDDDAIRNALVRASAALGQGDNSSIRTPLEPVLVPAELLATSPKPLPAGEVEAQGVQYLDRTVAIQYERGKGRRVTERWRLKFYNEKGPARFRILRFEFDPLGQSIYANEILVRDADGKVAWTGKVDDYYVSDESVRAAEGMASNRKQLNIPVAGLQAGGTLEVVVTWQNRPDERGFTWYQDILERQTPAARQMTVLVGDVDYLRWDASPELKTVKGDHYIAWTREPSPPWVVEPFEPVVSFARPWLAIAEANLSWKTEVTSYLARIADTLGPDNETKAVHLIEAAPDATKEEQIRSLVKYVQTHCSYRAIEFGRRADIPSRPGETLRRRYGDCKDQAVLVRELLSLSGVEAYLALASTSSPILTNLPSGDQFNHMIVYLPDEHGGRFVDTTARASDPFLTPRWALGGAQVLVLDPANPRFVTVPSLQASDSQILVDRRIATTNETNLVISEEVEVTGLAATWLRSLLVGPNGESLVQQAQRAITSTSPGIVLDAVNCEGLDDSFRPLRLVVQAHAQSYLQRSGNRLAGNFPATWELLWVSPDPVQRRRLPMEIRRPWKMKSNNRIDLPAGYTWPAAESLNRRQDSDFILASAIVSGSGAKQSLVVECESRPGIFPAERGPERQQALLDALRLVGPSIILEKSPEGK
ncbi:MAG TPA: DUF3857 domain-containing protein [Candidatus Limnocylindria bacterium]|nr:DUF3857 domain-containing protein [Candidatus Limnocylindria bacterium]